MTQIDQARPQVDTRHHKIGPEQDRKVQLAVIRGCPDASIEELAELFNMLAIMPGQSSKRGSAIPLHHPNDGNGSIPTDKSQVFIP